MTMASAERTIKKDLGAWEVTAPLPIKGNYHLLPAQLTPSTRRRRISVEIHHVTSVSEGSSSSTSTVDALLFKESEVCYVRILHPRSMINTINPVDLSHRIFDPIANKFRGDPTKANKPPVNFFTGISRNKSEDAAEQENDDESVMLTFKEESDGTAAQDQSWRPRYKIPIQLFNIVERKNRSVFVQFESKSSSNRQEFVFDSEAGMVSFCTVIQQQKKLIDDLLKAQVEDALKDIKLKKDEEVTLLFDICSGTDLPRSDIAKNSDPYVTVRFNGKKIHKTDFISNQANPIWTLRKGALFLWKVSALELFQSEKGLVFDVKDYDAFASNETLGTFNIDARTLYKWNGERREFALKSAVGGKDLGQGKISLRVRRATVHDIRFMESYKERKKPDISPAPAPIIKAGSPLKNIIAVHSKKEKEGPDKGKIKYLTRPGPDPKRRIETAWLTKEKIEEESMKPSYEWLDIGSGHLGKIFVEIISCDKLPNKDTGILGNKTDAFVSVVYEDTFARTDVIEDCLSPRWMPWSRRAFIFNCMHTSSQINLAVFDNDQGPIGYHDFIGRVSVDISNFRPNLMYLLQYNLYPTAKCAPREAKLGTIQIRLRMEMEPERTLLLSNLHLPLGVYVNVESKRDFEVIRQTVEGCVDTKKYSIDTIWSHYEELWSYLTIYYLLEDVFMSVILWRGHSKISLPMPHISLHSLIKWVQFDFPLHSLVLFICCVSIVEYPDLLPSFFFLSLGWILLATAERRTSDPNPWTHCKTFSHFASALIFGDSIAAPKTIKMQKADADRWEKRLREAEERAKNRADEYTREQEQYWKDLEEIGDTNQDLSEQRSGGFFLDPVRAYLYPYQQWLRLGCIWMRVFKNILIWEECYLSFWIALTSLSLAVVVFFLPWGLILKWTLRIVVWVTLGPWMKLIDVFLIDHVEEETDALKTERMNKLQRERQKWLDQQKLEALIVRENVAKLRDFKQYMFGQHIIQVNTLKKDRYYDIPLPSSTSTPYYPGSKSLGELAMQEAGYHRVRITGQQLVGDMIPQIFATPTMEAPTGQPTKHTDLLDKGSPALFYDSNDSLSAAAIKIGSILVGAGAITWYGVPLLVYLMRLLLSESEKF
ncbi:hypothetical protein ACHAXH_003556 [Discostella pseudostelligera]